MITEQMEEYLETIYRLEAQGKKAKTGDIAKGLSVGPPAVTDMIQRLEAAKLVTYERYKGVVLTDEGRQIGKNQLEKHRVMQAFLQEVCGMEHDKAHLAACSMEHSIPRELHDWMGAHLEELRGKPIDLRKRIRDQI